MESLGYTLMKLLKGSLPWENIQQNNKNNYRNKILLKKQESLAKSLIHLGYPAEFDSYFQHCTSLEFEDKPDYK
jgi:casein kinase 1